LAVPGGKIALIRENAALLFWESRGSLSVRLSGAILQLKITANSTYWKAKLLCYGLEDGEWGKKGKGRGVWGGGFLGKSGRRS
jgi:hypothetical protein